MSLSRIDNDSKEFEYRAIGEIASISAGNSAPQDPNLFEDIYHYFLDMNLTLQGDFCLQL